MTLAGKIAVNLTAATLEPHVKEPWESMGAWQGAWGMGRDGNMVWSLANRQAVCRQSTTAPRQLGM